MPKHSPSHQFRMSTYSESGTRVEGTARLEDGREVRGWIQAGWFCPPAGTPTAATGRASPE